MSSVYGQVYALPLAGATRFIYWKPSKQNHPHKIWNVNGTLEILCTHSKCDLDNIERHIKKYLLKHLISF